jgi:hypothetical protein
MAKKIVINFLDNPTAGTLVSPALGFEYGIFINGTALVYNNGLSNVVLQFVPYGSVGYNPQYIVEVQPTLEQTILVVMSFLQTRYTHPNIIYSIVGNTIEVAVNVQEYMAIVFGANNPNITTVSQTLSDDFINLKYFLQYKNIVNDEYICRIYQKNYVGDATEIHGKAILDKASVKDHLDVFRGGGLALELEASLDLTLEDFYTEKEQDFSVRLYKNGALFFYGYINPEGLFQSYTRDRWVITLDCVDGLGSLKDLSFVDPVGVPFLGKYSAKDIVYYSLLRSGISLPINVSINILYDGLTYSETLDILTKIYLNCDRFQRLDQETIMSCEEVLKSVFDLFCACITQQDGEWYIYKPNELFENAYVNFRRYNIDNGYVGNVTKNLNKVLGSQIDNFYPHHCGGNQNIQIKGSISKYRINYKYGFVSGIMLNPNLKHDSNLNYNGWTVLRPADLINDPLKTSGFAIKDSTIESPVLAFSSNIPVLLNDLLSLKMDFSAISVNNRPSKRFLVMKINVGSYYLKYEPNSSNASIADAANFAVWSTDSNSRYTLNLISNGFFDVSIPAIPQDGNMVVSIIRQKRPPLVSIGTIPNATVYINKLDFISTRVSNAEVGEFHTVSRAIRVSSNVKEVKTVFNGDSVDSLFAGAIFKEDQITPTEAWSRNGRLESYPILRIANEEEMRISQKPLKEFKGSIYGYIPYLSVININNIANKFMFIEYSYDTMTNIGTYKLLELFAPEVQDLMYKFTYDFGNTVKPTIVS